MFAQQVRNVAGVLGGDPPDVVALKLGRTIEGLLEDDEAEEVVRHIALMIGLQADRSMTPETVSGRHILFASARVFVEALARRQPTVLVFEDLHWADSSLLELIELLSAQVTQARLLMLAAARPELQATRPRWGASGLGSVGLALEPLGEDHARDLADRLLARAAQQLAGPVANAISETGEGSLVHRRTRSRRHRALVPSRKPATDEHPRDHRRPARFDRLARASCPAGCLRGGPGLLGRGASPDHAFSPTLAGAARVQPRPAISSD